LFLSSFLSIDFSPVLLNGLFLFMISHLSLLITEARFHSTWKWINSFEVLGGAGIVLMGVVPVVHGEIVSNTIIPGRLFSGRFDKLLHEINLSVTGDWFALVSSLSWVVSWFIFAPALLIDIFIEVFLQTDTSP
jgi:hypothetical protein